jgi:hypothetical protein
MASSIVYQTLQTSKYIPTLLQILGETFGAILE